jgi:hypothetical protein
MYGYRVEIEPADAKPGLLRHFAGYDVRQPGATFYKCPNCGNQMFPAINIDCSDQDIRSLEVWDAQYLNVLFCPFCAFYMKPYWIKYRQVKVVEIIGGDTSSNRILQNIETPYVTRAIGLRKLKTEDDPRSDAVHKAYRMRTKPPGVYHQVGGFPINRNDEPLKCPICSLDMRFAGILDYDDLNVPLHEDNHRPVSLIIGDQNSINYYTCRNCLVVGLKWIF